MQTIFSFFASINVTLFVVCFAVWAVLYTVAFQNFGRMFEFFLTRGFRWQFAAFALVMFSWGALIAFDWKTGLLFTLITTVIDAVVRTVGARSLQRQLKYVDFSKAAL